MGCGGRRGWGGASDRIRVVSSEQRGVRGSEAEDLVNSAFKGLDQIGSASARSEWIALALSG